MCSAGFQADCGHFLEHGWAHSQCNGSVSTDGEDVFNHRLGCGVCATPVPQIRFRMTRLMEMKKIGVQHILYNYIYIYIYSQDHKYITHNYFINFPVWIRKFTLKYDMLITVDSSWFGLFESPSSISSALGPTSRPKRAERWTGCPPWRPTATQSVPPEVRFLPKLAPSWPVFGETNRLFGHVWPI